MTKDCEECNDGVVYEDREDKTIMHSCKECNEEQKGVKSVELANMW